MKDLMPCDLFVYATSQCLIRGIPSEVLEKIVNSAVDELHANGWLSLTRLEQIIREHCVEAGLDEDTYRRDWLYDNYFGWVK